MSRRRILRKRAVVELQEVRSPSITRPPMIWPGGRVMRMSAVAIVVLPEPDSPIRPRRWPGTQRERDVIDRGHVPGVRPVDDLQVLDPQDGLDLGGSAAGVCRRGRSWRFDGHQSRRSRGFAKRSIPADVTNRARKMNAIIRIGGPHHHQNPRQHRGVLLRPVDGHAEGLGLDRAKAERLEPDGREHRARDGADEAGDRRRA